MKRLRAVFGIVGLVFAAAACGGDGSATPDAAAPRDGAGADASDMSDASVDGSLDAGADATPGDAPSYDFSCLGNAAPTTAPVQIMVTGTAQDINLFSQMFEGVANATVAAYRANETAIVGASDVTDAQGNFAFTITNAQQTPIDGYLAASAAGKRNVRVYPASPISENLSMVPILLLSSSNFELIRSQVAMKPQSAANGTVGLLVVDCANQPIAGATISVIQGNVEYADDAHTWDASQFQPGAFLVYDVPPGDVVVSATYNGQALRAHTVKSVAQTTTNTIVRPGF